MHDHDLDLIAALADGSLEDTAAARQLVESCAQCRDEFQAQQRAVTALRAVAAATLSADERRQLRTTVWDQIGPKASQASRQWWVPVGAVAAGMLVLVAVLGVLNEQRSPTPTTVAAALTTTTAAADLLRAEEDAAVAAEAESQGFGGALRATIEELPPGDAAAVGAAVGDFVKRTEAEPLDDAEMQILQVAEMACVDRLGENVLRAVATSQLDDRWVMVFVVEDVVGLRPLIYDQETCEPVELEIPD